MKSSKSYTKRSSLFLLLGSLGWLAGCSSAAPSGEEGAASIAQAVGASLGGLVTANPAYDPNPDNYPENPSSHLPLLHSNPGAAAVIFLDYDGGNFAPDSNGFINTYPPSDWENIGTSSTSNVIGVGSKSFTTQSGLGYQAGDRVRAVEFSGLFGTFLEGRVTSYSSGNLVLLVDYTSGSGTWSNWHLHNLASPIFNAEERANILEQWRQVAMWFSMFNVDITTEQPISPSIRPFLWIGVTDSNGGNSGTGFPSTIYTSSFVGDFPGPNSNFGHEASHAFGCLHSGDFNPIGIQTRETGTQPSTPLITSFHGLGSQQNDHMTKWVYKTAGTINAAALDPSLVQDEISTIAQSLQAKLLPFISPFRPTEPDGSDDFPDTRSVAAPPLSTTGTNRFARAGTLNSLADVDYFRFAPTLAGYYSILVGRDAPSSVDTQASIEDSAGGLLASLDGDPSLTTPTTNVFDQHLTRYFTPGTYYIRVASHGAYADFGQYVVRADYVGDATNPWQVQDIGVNGVPGYAFSDTAGSYEIAGSGHDIWGGADGMTLYSQRLQGDGFISARVTGLNVQDDWSQVGITIRDSLAPGAKHISLMMTRAHGWIWAARSTTGGSSTGNFERTSLAFAPRYLKITRTGNQFSLYASTNGTNWGTAITTQSIAMSSSPAYIGLVASGVSDSNITPLTGWPLAIIAAQRLALGTLTNVVIDKTGGGVLNPKPYPNIDTSLIAPALSIGPQEPSFDRIFLSWTDPNSNETGYIVEQSEDNINWREVAIASPNVTAYTDGGLGDARRYYYRVRAKGSSGLVSQPSIARAAVTRAGVVNVGTLRTFSLGTSDIALYWDDVDGETGYNVYRADALNGNYQVLGSVPANLRFFDDDANKSANRTYWYKFETVDAKGISATSNAVSVTTRWTDSAPSGLQISGTPTATSITLDWVDLVVAGVAATTYTVYRNNTDGNPGWTVAGTSQTSSFTDSGLARGTLYHYQVVGYTSSTGAVSAGATLDARTAN